MAEHVLGRHHAEDKFPEILEAETAPDPLFLQPCQIHRDPPDRADGSTEDQQRPRRGLLTQSAQRDKQEIQLNDRRNEPQLQSEGADILFEEHFIKEDMAEQGAESCPFVYRPVRQEKGNDHKY